MYRLSVDQYLKEIENLQVYQKDQAYQLNTLIDSKNQEISLLASKQLLCQNELHRLAREYVHFYYKEQEYIIRDRQQKESSELLTHIS